jgi:adenylate cyclase
VPDDEVEESEQSESALRRIFTERLAALLRRDPELAAEATEVGLIDRRWLDDPDGSRPVSTASTGEVLQRFLERSSERKPSVLTSLGLNAVQALSNRRSPADGSTQTLTVVFTDLEGFTRFNADNGDSAAVELLAEHHRLVGPVVRSRGGRIVKRMGDGLLLAFPEPDAAVLAAVELLATAPAPLRLRSGIHYGEAVVSRDDLTGHVVNVAARVTEEAKGGSVLLTADVLDAIDGDLRGVKFTKPSNKRLRGVPEKVGIAEAIPTS